MLEGGISVENIGNYIRSYTFPCDKPRLTYSTRSYHKQLKYMNDLEVFIKALETLYEFSNVSGIPLYFASISSDKLNDIDMVDEGILVRTCLGCLLCNEALYLLFNYKCKWEYCYNKVHDKAVELYMQYIDWKKQMKPILELLRKYNL